MGLPKVERPLTIFNVAAPSAATKEMHQIGRSGFPTRNKKRQ